MPCHIVLVSSTGRSLSTAPYRYEPVHWRSVYKANGKIYYFTNDPAPSIAGPTRYTANEPIIHALGDRVDQRAMM